MTTLEVRWFCSGTVPQAVTAWFETSIGTPNQPEERTDLYLSVRYDHFIPPESVLADALSKLNIKQRQNRLELKWCWEQLGSYWFSNRLEGVVERWQKWSSVPVLPRIFIPGWVEVNKVRSQRYYLGLSYELTQLTLKNRLWWSLAVESSAHDERQFEQIIKQIFLHYPGPTLLSQSSVAYPGWISRQ